MAQVLQHLPSKHEALSSNSSTVNKKQKKTKMLHGLKFLHSLGFIPWLSLILIVPQLTYRDFSDISSCSSCFLKCAMSQI
jgi:hypothetical protein